MAACEYVGVRGNVRKISSMTLDQLVEMHRIENVDLLKVDIEGAEDKIFKESEFVRDKVNKIIIEIHNASYGQTSIEVISQLESLGFKCQLIEQVEVDLPLLMASKL